MRVTIIPVDGFVSVDGEGYYGVNVSAIDPDVNAVQWYGSEGEIERKDSRGRIVFNEAITDFTPYQPVLDAWQVAKVAAVQAELDRQAEEAAHLAAEQAEAERLAIEALAQQAAEQPSVETP